MNLRDHDAMRAANRLAGETVVTIPSGRSDADWRRMESLVATLQKQISDLLAERAAREITEPAPTDDQTAEIERLKAREAELARYRLLHPDDLDVVLDLNAFLREFQGKIRTSPIWGWWGEHRIDLTCEAFNLAVSPSKQSDAVRILGRAGLLMYGPAKARHEGAPEGKRVVGVNVSILK